MTIKTSKLDCQTVLASPLGKHSAYLSHYTAELLFPIPRKGKRDEIGVPLPLPFHGFDTWNAYEVSWLNPNGKPVVAMLQCEISCTSVNIIESKSFKLYLNSFNNTPFNSAAEVKLLLERDIRFAVDGEVIVYLLRLDDLLGQTIERWNSESLDDEDVVCNAYTINPDTLQSSPTEPVTESLCSDLLKSNCLVTGQPDWGSVRIDYHGPKIDRAGLLKYIVSFRNHNEFHEQCVERIFMDIMTYCKPEQLTVEARYTRRGGLDINPIRSTEAIKPAANIRMARQ